MEDEGITWSGFKNHFRAAYKAMKCIGVLALRDTFDKIAVVNMIHDEITAILSNKSGACSATDGHK